MGKLLTVDDLEIRFEKQHPSHASKWCIYIRAKLGEKTKSLLMIKTDKKPYTCLLYTSPSPRDKRQSRMPSSA